jgi:hypothetical protein
MYLEHQFNEAIKALRLQGVSVSPYSVNGEMFCNVGNRAVRQKEIVGLYEVGCLHLLSTASNLSR